jgi:hypothetical protein
MHSMLMAWLSLLETEMGNCLAWAHSYHIRGWNSDIVGYIASSMVFTTFCMQSMRPLRFTAIVSNFAFIWYAIVADLPPILLLHSTLLPVNIVRLVQIELKSMRDAQPRATALKQWWGSKCKARGIHPEPSMQSHTNIIKVT